MGRIKDFFNRHQILEMALQLILAIAVNVFCFTYLTSWALGWLEGTFPNFQFRFLTEVFAYFCTLLTAFLLGYRHLYQKAIVNFRTIWLICLPLTLIMALMVLTQWTQYYVSYGNPWHSSVEIFFGVLLYISVGFYEELFCRGLLLNICWKHLKKNTFSMWLTILISSLAFGGMHFINLLSGAKFESILLQVIYAAEIGIFLGAIYFRTRSLVLVSLLHGLWDLVASLYEVLYEYVDFAESLNQINYAPVILFGVFAVFGAFILRKGYLVTEGIEDNKIRHKVIFILTFLLVAGIFVYLFVFTYRIDQMSVQEYIEYKKNHNYYIR